MTNEMLLKSVDTPTQLISAYEINFYTHLFIDRQQNLYN
jgi:hypothetical protein